MYLRCCHRKISVFVKSDVRDLEGHPTYGLFELTAPPQIVLDRCTPRDDRRSIVVHELGHAWDEIAGEVNPADDESRQNRLSAIEAQFSTDLDEQGGESIIHALFGDVDENAPDDAALFDGVERVTDDEQADWPTRICCVTCHQTHASSKARNGTPSFNPRLNCFVLWRVLFCGECGKEMRWEQRCNYEGLPLPDVTVPPTSRTLMADSIVQ